MNRRQLMAYSAAAFAARVGFADSLAQAQGSDAHRPSKRVDLPDRLLLKDWRPRSIYKILITEVAKARYPVIDVHNHGVNIAEQARKIVVAMDATNLERGVIFTGTGRPESFAQARAIYSAYPQRLICGASLTSGGQQSRLRTRRRESAGGMPLHGRPWRGRTPRQRQGSGRQCRNGTRQLAYAGRVHPPGAPSGRPADGFPVPKMLGTGNAC